MNMGDMTNHALDAFESAQGEAMEYLAGDFDAHEAYDRGLIDHNGAPAPHMREAMEWDNEQDMSPEGVDAALERFLDTAPEFYSAMYRTEAKVYRAQVNGRTIELNAKAYANLAHDAPTCNVCGYRMRRRNGQYGPFFFCYNGCADQKTVSAEYWRSVKEAFNKG